MKICLDVDYRERGAAAAGVVFADWADAVAAAEAVEHVAGVAEYEPGSFYKRELPCLLAVLARLPDSPSLIIVDGYVWLEGEDKPGLGGRLFDALGGKVPVVGVGKTRFASCRVAVPVVRGDQATRPLWVTAAGMDAQEAATAVKGMHGPHRIPTLLKRVDTLCRTAIAPWR